MHQSCKYQIFKNNFSTLYICRDGDSNSPGYSAKYKTYSLMDSLLGKMLNFCVVHVGTMKNSLCIELQGTHKCIKDLENPQKKINTIHYH